MFRLTIAIIVATFALVYFQGMLNGLFLDILRFDNVWTPDFILILVVSLSFIYHNSFAVIIAFVLGIIGDVADGRFLGPNAAGCVIAYLIAVLLSTKLYTPRFSGQFFIVCLASCVKSTVNLFVVGLFLKTTLSASLFMAIGIQALTTGLVAPLIIRFVVKNSGTQILAVQKFRKVMPW